MGYHSTDIFSGLSSQRVHQQKAIIRPTHEFPYRENISSRLQELICLELGWDGYRAKPVSFDKATFAMNMLEAIYSTNIQTNLPSIVPGVSGDLQIEWHYNGYAIELYVISPHNVCASFYHEDNNTAEELELTSDFSQVITWIKKMMQENTNAKIASVR